MVIFSLFQALLSTILRTVERSSFAPFFGSGSQPDPPSLFADKREAENLGATSILLVRLYVTHNNQHEN